MKLTDWLPDWLLHARFSDTPESWLCVDCGFDTSPGSLGRSKMFAAYKANSYTVPRIDISSQSPDQEVYTVRDVIWQEAGKPSGCLCIGCLEKRLGRRLKPKDFARGDTFNDPRLPASPRLRSRRKDR